MKTPPRTFSLRVMLAAVVAFCAVLFTTTDVVRAGLGAGAVPTLPMSATVGDVGLPANLVLINNNTTPQTGQANTVCNAGDPSKCAGPGIVLTPACGDVGANFNCTALDPGVYRLSSTGVGRAGSACDAMIFDIVEIDAASGQVRFTPRNLGHVVLQGDPNRVPCVVDFTVDILKSPTFDQDPSKDGIQTIAIASNFQISSNLVAAGSGSSESVTIKARPNIVTTASAAVTVGGQLTDTATVTDRVNPRAGATVDFRLYGPDDATCARPPIFESLGVPYPLAGGPVTSSAFTATAVGTYRWRATYNGDANNGSVTGDCSDVAESVVVTKASPAITTSATPAGVVGGSLIDNATVTNRVNPLPGATIDFRAYGPNDATCANPPAFESLGVPYPVSGGAVVSAAFVPTSPGVYRWRATYNGDGNNLAVTGECNALNENSSVETTTTTSTTTTPTTVQETTSGPVQVVSGPTLPQPLLVPPAVIVALPETGQESTLPATLFGIGLLAVGGAFVGVSRRRRRI